MPVCNKHGHYYSDGWYCKKCHNEGSVKARQQVKEEVPKLIKKSLQKFTAKMKTIAIKISGKIQCCTCPEKVSATKSGIWGIHWGHLYDKSIYWLFMLDPRNGGHQCYNCNVNLKGNKVKLEEYVKTKLGPEQWKEFTAEIKAFDNQRKQGILPDKPTLKMLKYLN